MKKELILLLLSALLLSGLLLWEFQSKDSASSYEKATTPEYSSTTASSYQEEWQRIAVKPSWWHSIKAPSVPPIEDIHTVRRYTNQILTEPCCSSDQYKHQRKILSKAMYQVVIENEHNPYIAASAFGHVNSNSVNGWDRQKLLEFYLKHFYWVDYTSCASCLVGDLSWYRVKDLAYIYNNKGNIRKAINLIEKYLKDRGHQLHPRYHFKAQGMLAQFAHQLGDKQAVTKLESFLEEMKPQLTDKNLQHYFDEQLKNCKRLKKQACDISS